MLTYPLTFREALTPITSKSSQSFHTFHGTCPCRPAQTKSFQPRHLQNRLSTPKIIKQRHLHLQVKASAVLQGTPGLLIGLGAFLAGAALAAFLLAAIPMLMSVRRAAQAMEVMLCTVEREFPDTAAAVRLSSMEISDAIEEVTLLSNDISQGVRSSAAAVTAAEQGVRQGAQYLNLAVKDAIIPSVKSRVPAARGAVETQLQQSADLQHTEQTIRQLAQSTKTVAGQVRFGLGLFSQIGRAAVAKQLLQQRAAI